VTGEWQKFTYDFTAPAYPPNDPFHQHLALELTGPGKLWIDNFHVYQYDSTSEFRPFTPHTVSFGEMMRSSPPRGKKPSIRFYPTTYGTHSPMDLLLGNYAGSSIEFIGNLRPGVNITVPHCLYYCYKSGATPLTRFVPYFTLSEEYTEVEWKALVEYLGVPYDPSTDSPQSKPWAYKRFKQRGTGTPWTDEFREIVIEYGNESWHNGAAFGWDGFGKPSWVWGGGVEYGLFARYMFDEQVGGMPEWAAYDLRSKIKFAVNGGYMVGINEYGENTIQKTKGNVAYVTHANYVGPKWETGDQEMTVFNADGMQRTLVGAGPGFKEGYLLKHREFRDRIRAMGVNYDLLVYEGGPSGYVIGGTEQQATISDRYGKSVGMAVAALDAWLYSTYVGYKHQNFLGYGSGRGGWNSHSMPEAGGLRQYAGWMAMAMRNNYGVGDRMVKAAFSSLPTYQDATAGDGDIPLIASYAMRTDYTWSVFVLSRKLGGSHNGADFGDGYTPVTINLPFTGPQLVMPDNPPPFSR